MCRCCFPFNVSLLHWQGSTTDALQGGCDLRKGILTDDQLFLGISTINIEDRFGYFTTYSLCTHLLPLYSLISRSILLQCLAAENPEVKVLNYSPGLMLTTMTENFHNTVAVDSTKKTFQAFKEGNLYVDTDESAKKMLGIVKEGSFTSGEQIDFHDC